MATMRTPPKAVEEIKAKDPNSSITLAALRRWIKTGAVSSVRVGRNALVDMDKLEAFLSSGGAANADR